MSLADIYAALQSEGGPAKPDVADRIRHEAERSPGAFANFLDSVPLNDACSLFEIYEVLLQDSQRFSRLLMSEFMRLVKRAKAEPQNAAIYEQLGAFALSRDEEIKRSLAVVLAELLRASAPQIRRFAADLAGDCMARHDSGLASQLQSMLTLDTDWRARILAYSSLRDLQAQDPSRALDLRLSVLDRVRKHLLAARVHQYAA